MGNECPNLDEKRSHKWPEMKLLACGFNAFKQLDGIHEDYAVNISTDKKEESIHCLPIELCCLNNGVDKIVDICISWSCIYLLVTDISGKRKLYSFGSNVSKDFNGKQSNVSDIAVTTNHIVCFESDKLVLHSHSGSENVTTSLKGIKTFPKNNTGISEVNLIPDDSSFIPKKIISAEQCIYIIDDFGLLRKVDYSRSKESLTLQHISVSLTVSHVSCGKEHSMLTTTTNQVYSWGLGSRGQLGNGDVEEIESPKEIEALAGLCVTEISAGGWHSSAITSEGDLYVWGWNESGQLGLPCPALRSIIENIESVAILTLPQCVDIDRSVNVVKCGSRHTCILLDDGTVMASGWNQYGQLGLGDLISRDNFTKINLKFYNTCNVKDIFCSNWNSLFVMDN